MINGLDPSTAQITVNGLTPQRTTFFLKAITNGNKSNIVPVDITVCGLESLSTKNKTQQEFWNIYNSTLNDFGYSFINLTDFFEFEVGPSHDLCAQSTFLLFKDEACTQPWTETEKAELKNNGTTWLHIKDDFMFNDTLVYLQRTTRGKVSDVQKFNITTCGLEIIYSELSN
jgi:hypothetical protein